MNNFLLEIFKSWTLNLIWKQSVFRVVYHIQDLQIYKMS